MRPTIFVSLVAAMLLAGSAPALDYWLDRDLGPVRINSWELVSIEESVATEAQTWSEVKSLYR